MTTVPTKKSPIRVPSISRRDCLSALLCASAGLAASGFASRAWAQTVDWEHVVGQAGQLRVLTQRMSKETLLIALQHDVDENVQSLRANGERFARILRGLRRGDADLMLPGTTDPALLDKLRRIEALWPAIGDLVAAVAESKTVMPDQLDVIAETNLPLLQATEETVGAFEAIANEGNAVTMLTAAIDLADSQPLLSQKMSKELYLIAIGHDVDGNRQLLSQSVERFDRVVNGLVFGDSELRLMPAPTEQIKSQLGVVQRLWNDFRPIASDAATGTAIDREMIGRSASLELALLNESTTLVGQYMALRPRRQGNAVPREEDGPRTS